MYNNEIEEAKKIIENIAKGINPINGEPITERSFFNDARVIRCFYYVVEILNNVKNGFYNSKGVKQFKITPEQKDIIKFPSEKIGVNEFSKCINKVLDLNISKKVTGVELNKKLKYLGILGEEKSHDGKMRTITNEKSKEYGFESEKRSYNGIDYNKVVINDYGKKYLLENIEFLMQK